MTSFDSPGADWEVGEDGVPWRRAARVLLFSADGRLLLATSHDLHDPSRSWWFTLGGGIEAGEDARTAAVREVEEETGIELDPDALLGPVATRSALLDFASGTVRQEEEYYLARLDGDVRLDRSRWTELERASMDGLRWMGSDELSAVDVEVFPPELPELAARLLRGWDGELHILA